MKKRFRGTYAELQDQVMLTGIFGEWRDLANHKQFRGDNGAILNWWGIDRHNIISRPTFGDRKT